LEVAAIESKAAHVEGADVVDENGGSHCPGWGEGVGFDMTRGPDFYFVAMANGRLFEDGL
jgi:hypothetical protein